MSIYYINYYCSIKFCVWQTSDYANAEEHMITYSNDTQLFNQINCCF